MYASNIQKINVSISISKLIDEITFISIYEDSRHEEETISALAKRGYMNYH